MIKMLVEELKNKLKERRGFDRPIHPVEIIREDWKGIEDFSIKEGEPTIEIIREESGSAMVLSILLCMDNHVIGYVSSIYWKRPPLVVSSHFWFMESLSVKKEFRHRGYGTLIMKTLMKELDGFVILTLCRKEMIPFHTEILKEWTLVERCKDTKGRPISQYALIHGVKIKKDLNKEKA